MSNNTKNIIEINGKRYDAVSGSLIVDKPAASKPTPAGQYVDGFRRTSSSAPAALAPVKAVKHHSQHSQHSTAAHAQPHKPETAKTLMRTAVKKPDIKAPSRLKARHRTDVLARVPVQVVEPKLSQTSINPKRLKKAVQTVQSPAVSRYAPTSTIASKYTISPFVTRAHSIPPTTHQNHKSHAGPASASPNPQVHIPVGLTVQHGRDLTKQPDIFEQALSRATSHEQRFDGRGTHNAGDSKKKRSRLTTLVTTSMSLLLVAGIVAYLNSPVLSVRLASSKAGFSAKLPGYSPAGYSFGDLSYGPGNVTVSYEDPSAENKKFDITQRTSNWDSQALLTNFVASANKAYQTYERAGRTVYFFGNNTATWVDNGIWFTVNGNNSLSKNQLLDLAGSI